MAASANPQQPAPEALPNRAEAHRMADCILSGLTGTALSRALALHFPNITRLEVFAAIGMAATAVEADLRLAELEIDMLTAHKGSATE